MDFDQIPAIFNSTALCRRREVTWLKINDFALKMVLLLFL